MRGEETLESKDKTFDVSFLERTAAGRLVFEWNTEHRMQLQHGVGGADTRKTRPRFRGGCHHVFFHRRASLHSRVNEISWGVWPRKVLRPAQLLTLDR